MKIWKNSFSMEKRPVKKDARQFVSILKKSSKRDLSAITDENSTRKKDLSADDELITNNTHRNLKKGQEESKYSFVVDWQIPKHSEPNKKKDK